MAYQIDVSSSATHLIKADDNPIKGAIVSSILTGNDFLGTLMKEKMSSLGIKMQAAFAYAKDQYVLALPGGITTQLNVPTETDVANAIKVAISYPSGVIVNSFRYTLYEPWHEVADVLKAERNLNYTTGILYKYPGLKFSNLQQLVIIGSAVSPDRLTIDMRYMYQEYQSQQEWRLMDPNNSESGQWVTYQIWTNISQHTESILRSSTINTIFNDRCLIALYQKLDAQGALLPELYQWIYRLDSNTYPELDDRLKANITDEYFPVIPVRYNNQDLTGQDANILPGQISDIDDRIAVLQAEMLAIYPVPPVLGGMNFTQYRELMAQPYWKKKQEIATLTAKKAKIQTALNAANTVRNTELYKTSKALLDILKIPIDKMGEKINASPYIADMDHAYVIFGADIQSNEPATLTYLHNYFQYLKTLSVSNYISTSTAAYSDSSFTEHGLRLKIEYDNITTDYVPGKLNDGKIGNARKQITTTTVPGYWTTTGVGEMATTFWTDSYVDTVLILEVQETAQLIHRVLVYNLRVTNYIDGDYSVTTTMDKIKNDPDNHNLIIPLQYSMSLDIPVTKRTALYSDCALLIINSVVKTKLKWYQSSIFAAVIMIVAIVIVAWTGQAWVLGAMKAFEAGAIALAVYVATQIVITTVITLTMGWVVRTYGTKIGIVGAIALAIVALAIGQGELAVDFIAKFTITYAQLALQCAMALISASNEFIKKATEQIISEYNQFTNLLEEAQKALDTNAELKALELRPDLNPLEYIRAKRYFSIANEYPDAFFDRTLNLPSNTYYGVHGAVRDFTTNLLRIDKSTVMGMGYR